MKITFTILSFILILGSFTVAAQENEIPSNDPIFVSGGLENNLNEERPLLFELDSKLLKKDSLQIKNSSSLKGKSDQKPSSSKNDDALSFNFLYYIIQKFKISDLIDN